MIRDELHHTTGQPPRTPQMVNFNANFGGNRCYRYWYRLMWSKHRELILVEASTSVQLEVSVNRGTSVCNIPSLAPSYYYSFVATVLRCSNFNRKWIYHVTHLDYHSAPSTDNHARGPPMYPIEWYFESVSLTVLSLLDFAHEVMHRWGTIACIL